MGFVVCFCLFCLGCFDADVVKSMFCVGMIGTHMKEVLWIQVYVCIPVREFMMRDIYFRRSHKQFMLAGGMEKIHMTR